MSFLNAAKSMFDWIPTKQNTLALKGALAHAENGTSPNDEKFQSAVHAASYSLRYVPEGKPTKLALKKKQFNNMLKAQDHPALWWAAHKGAERFSLDEILYALRCALAHTKRRTSPDDTSFQTAVRVASSRLSNLSNDERANFADVENQFNKMLKTKDRPDLWRAAYAGTKDDSPDGAVYVVMGALSYANRGTSPNDQKFKDAVGAASYRLNHLPEDERTKLADTEKQFLAMLETQNHPDLWWSAYKNTECNSSDEAFYATKTALAYAKRDVSPNYKGYQESVSTAVSCLIQLPQEVRIKLSAAEEQFNKMLETQASPLLIKKAQEASSKSGAPSTQSQPYTAMLTPPSPT